MHADRQLWICGNCEHLHEHSIGDGLEWLEVASIAFMWVIVTLFCLFAPSGIVVWAAVGCIHSWRVRAKQREPSCSSCGQRQWIPSLSPRGKELLAKPIIKRTSP